MMPVGRVNRQDQADSSSAGASLVGALGIEGGLQGPQPMLGAPDHPDVMRQALGLASSGHAAGLPGYLPPQLPASPLEG